LSDRDSVPDYAKSSEAERRFSPWTNSKRKYMKIKILEKKRAELLHHAIRIISQTMERDI
jgi:hypothetical protein